MKRAGPRRAIGMVAILAALGSTGPVGAETSAATQGMPQLLAGRLDAGSRSHVHRRRRQRVRCWGAGWCRRSSATATRTTSVTPSIRVPPALVDLGPNLRAVSVAAGAGHTCALADDSAVRCWGLGYGGRLGYANTLSIGDDERPAVAGPVDLGRRVRAITAGGYHTCAILDDWTVRCWGVGFTYFGSGHLGYGNTLQIGDDETPGSVGPVDLGAGRTARAITAGENHTCAILDTGQVRCWGSVTSASWACRSSRTSATTRRPGVSPRWTSVPVARRRRSAPATTTHASSSMTARCAAGAWAPTAPSTSAGRSGDRHRRRERAHLRRSSTTAPCAAGARRAHRQARLRQPERHRRRRGTGQRRAGRSRSRSPRDGDHRRDRPHLRRPRRRTDPLLGHPRARRTRAVRPSVADRRRRDAGPAPAGEPRREDLRRARCRRRRRRRVGRARSRHARGGPHPIQARRRSAEYRITWARPGQTKHTQRATTTKRGACSCRASRTGRTGSRSSPPTQPAAARRRPLTLSRSSTGNRRRRPNSRREHVGVAAHVAGRRRRQRGVDDRPRDDVGGGGDDRSELREARRGRADEPVRSVPPGPGARRSPARTPRRRRCRCGSG